MRITQYYIDLLAGQSFLIFRREDGSLVLLEKGHPLTLLDTLPPNAHPYEKAADIPSRLEAWWKGIQEDRTTYLPSPEHLAVPVALYHSEIDTVLLLETGATVHLSDKGIRFHTRGKGLSHELLDTSLAYTKISAEPVTAPTVHPVEPCFIISPGLDEWDIAGMHSIDFTLDESTDFSESGRAFRDIATEFAALTGGAVDTAAWDALWASRGKDGVIPFLKDGATIADLQMHGYPDLPDQDFYHDTLCITLRYKPELQEAVRQLVQNILANHRHVRLVPGREAKS